MSGLLQRLARNAAEIAGRDRRAVVCGPFRMYLAETSDEYLMSYAMPVETPASGWPEAVARLRQGFADNRRLMRLEFFDELYPTLAPALAAAGIYRNMAAPVMALERDAFRPNRTVGPGEIRLVSADDQQTLDGLLDAQWASFDMPFDAQILADWRIKLADGLREGHLAAAAHLIDGRVVAGATLMIGSEAAELAGVGTRPAWRRRGIASRLCARLLASHFDGGGGTLVWLSAGPGARALYSRLGFRTVGLQLNYGVRAKESG